MSMSSGTNFPAPPQYKPDTTHGEYEEESRHHDISPPFVRFRMLIKQLKDFNAG